MADLLVDLPSWVIPALLAAGVGAIAALVVVWAVRRAHRSPRARSAAEAHRVGAGETLVRLDDAVDDLDLDLALSGALAGPGAPPSVRRVRLSAQHVRDTSYEQYRAISAPEVAPDEIRRVSAGIQRRSADALAAISAARAEHAAWVQAHVPVLRLVEASRERLLALRSSMGDPEALVAELSSRFAEDEWAEASRAARASVEDADTAERLLSRAAAGAARGGDAARAAQADLVAAERALRRAEADGRVLEEAHRLALHAAQAVPAEFATARGALRQAESARALLDPVEAERLSAQVQEMGADLTAREPDAARRPTRTIDAIARLRERLDTALGDVPTAQQRIRAARTALPGTLAAARHAIARAEASALRTRAGADARSLLASAQSELAAARQAPDPIEALRSARRAVGDAERAASLADENRLGTA